MHSIAMLSIHQYTLILLLLVVHSLFLSGEGTIAAASKSLELGNVTPFSFPKINYYLQTIHWIVILEWSDIFRISTTKPSASTDASAPYIRVMDIDSFDQSNERYVFWFVWVYIVVLLLNDTYPLMKSEYCISADSINQQPTIPSHFSTTTTS